ncbi:site-specific integrase [Acidiphilium sp. PA]|jgi:site-specific recombinase XerD|uniref:site-specific integrase n=1 Tax=Acidiphilium sp. PA TaxID=2871705 RepID=UPI002244506E|nr:site-specific integrase [Acidiphilium sp. PA]MCW8309149.1 site-specific integrase [Acidiphilium sp. PA]
MTAAASFATLLTRYFTQRLIQQRCASPHTISSYRDTFHLLLLFAKTRLGKEPSQLTIEQIDAPLVSAFLDDLQNRRGISARSRNLRLTAIRSFFRFAAFELPAQSEPIQRILAIPCKRHVRKQIHYLTRPEVAALLAAPDRTTWSGRRDHAWLLLAVQTGLRLSELTGLTRQAVQCGAGAHVHVLGKGRKERCTPLTKQTTAVLQAWLKEPARGDGQIVFPNRQGGRMSNDGLQYLLAQHAKMARQDCPSLSNKKVSPHVLRHTAAMELLQAGVDTTVISLWLGHESVETTHVYLEADLAMKEKMLAKTTAHDGTPSVYRPPDALLAFLKAL